MAEQETYFASDEDRADMLSMLLGSLSYYAEPGGPALSKKRLRELLKELDPRNPDNRAELNKRARQQRIADQASSAGLAAPDTNTALPAPAGTPEL